MIDINKVSNIKIKEVDIKDHPKYSNAYIESGQYMNRALTQEEIDWIEETFPEFIMQQAYETLVSQYER